MPKKKLKKIEMSLDVPTEMLNGDSMILAETLREYIKGQLNKKKIKLAFDSNISITIIIPTVPKK